MSHIPSGGGRYCSAKRSRNHSITLRAAARRVHNEITKPTGLEESLAICQAPRADEYDAGAGAWPDMAKRSHPRLLEVTVVPLEPTRWEGRVYEGDTPLMTGFETSRETAQIEGDSALFRLLSAGSDKWTAIGCERGGFRLSRGPSFIVPASARRSRAAPRLSHPLLGKWCRRSGGPPTGLGGPYRGRLGCGFKVVRSSQSVSFSTSYSGYCLAEGITAGKSHNERKRGLDQVHFGPPPRKFPVAGLGVAGGISGGSIGSLM